jgi:predicted RecA/RadA family phage recombinase
MTNTYTLKSAAWIYTPSMVALAISEYASNPKWSIKLLREGFSLPVRVAKGLASGAIAYVVQNESVIFTA